MNHPVSRARPRTTANYGRMKLQAYLDEDSYRCAMSLRSELRLVETLLKVSKKCLCPKLKTHVAELYGRKVKLTEELKVRLKEEKFCTFVVDEAPASHHGIEPNTFVQKSITPSTAADG
jgi:hypothetical protein